MIFDVVRPKPKPVKVLKTKKRGVKKVSSRGSLIKDIHALMREIVIARDGKCVCPPPQRGHSGVLQAGHLIRSTKGATRWDLYNIHCQCSYCNGRHVHYEKYYITWFIKTFGGKEYVRLSELSDGVGLKTYELAELYEQLKAIRERQVNIEGFKPYFSQADILSGAWRESAK